uniref:Uncharacterized protein n=1 Tax=Anguilla anguilla TaxID=7936 RepID=A0A0E9VLC0_ANGAN
MDGFAILCLLLPMLIKTVLGMVSLALAASQDRFLGQVANDNNPVKQVSYLTLVVDSHIDC